MDSVPTKIYCVLKNKIFPARWENVAAVKDEQIRHWDKAASIHRTSVFAYSKLSVLFWIACFEVNSILK